EESTIGCFSTMVTMPSTISGPKCIGRRWKNFIKASKRCKNRKASAQSGARICSVFWTQIYRDEVSVASRWKATSHRFPYSERLWHVGERVSRSRDVLGVSRYTGCERNPMKGLFWRDAESKQREE